MNIEAAFFLTIGAAGISAALFMSIWAVLKVLELSNALSEITKSNEKAWECITHHRKTLANLTSVSSSMDRGIVLFAQKIYSQEQELSTLKQDLVTQRQVQALVQEALREVAN